MRMFASHRPRLRCVGIALTIVCVTVLPAGGHALAAFPDADDLCWRIGAVTEPQGEATVVPKLETVGTAAPGTAVGDGSSSSVGIVISVVALVLVALSLIGVPWWLRRRRQQKEPPSDPNPGPGRSSD